MDNELLVVDDLRVAFGGIAALEGVSFRATDGEVTAIVGANGAGKSTVLNAIGNVVSRTARRLEVDGEDIRMKPAAAIARRWLGRSFQHPRLLESRTVAENLELARGTGRAGTAAGATADTGEIAELFGISRYLDAEVGALPYAAHKTVDIARALMRRPRLLLLDEPTSGTDPGDSPRFIELIQSMPGQWCGGVILVEHNLKLVRSTAAKVVALEAGRVLALGPTAAVMDSPAFLASLQGLSSSHTPTSDDPTTKSPAVTS